MELQSCKTISVFLENFIGSIERTLWVLEPTPANAPLVIQDHPFKNSILLPPAKSGNMDWLFKSSKNLFYEGMVGGGGGVERGFVSGPWEEGKLRQREKSHF